MKLYVSPDVAERQALQYLRHLGLPAGPTFPPSRKPIKVSLPRNGRRGRRASMPRHSGGNKRTGN